MSSCPAAVPFYSDSGTDTSLLGHYDLASAIKTSLQLISDNRLAAVAKET
jgi:hypothetical protein